MSIPGLLVAGTRSGSGKTTCALALMAAFRARGFKVQAAKVGPDFIDPAHHQALCGRPSCTLDTWMCGLPATERLLARACAPRKTTSADLPGMRDKASEARPTHIPAADMLIVEGVMGLFDGADATGTGSSAEIAAHFGLPVLLVVDVRGMGHSVSALVHGFCSLRADLAFAGIVCSHVGSARHAEIIREALALAQQKCIPLPPLLGILLRAEAPLLPSRHLGLYTAHEQTLNPTELAHWIEHSVDVDALLERMRTCSRYTPVDTREQRVELRTRNTAEEDAGHTVAPALEECAPARQKHPVRRGLKPVRLGLAYDAAFCFLYPDLPDMLRTLGAEPIFFSPLAEALPSGLHGLIIPGGYPELFAAQLQANQGIRATMHAFARQGNPVYAECGGFIWLMHSITVGTTVLPMLDLLPVHCTLQERHAALGYRSVTSCAATAFGPAGTVLRGHEFHYALLHETVAAPLWQQRDRLGRDLGTEGILCKNIMASWVHTHFASNPEALATFVQSCAAYPAVIF